MTILTVNAGSSSLKFALYPVNGTIADSATLAGTVEGLESDAPLALSWRSGDQRGQARIDKVADDPFQDALKALQSLLQQALPGRDLQAVAHRVVHGGEAYRDAVRVDEDILSRLGELSPLAPLHQPHNIEGIRAFGRAFPEVPHIACFDTAFHAGIPDVEHLFALPRALGKQGIRRYGFHGLSYQYLMQKLNQLSGRAQGRLVMAHLGNGASLCGALQGQSLATTMGFSALDGLMMGTRSGSLDAGVLLHLMAQGWDHARLQDLLYRKSGLLGVSGISADMRRLRASEVADADLAIRMFTHRVTREAGAMAACLGGLDVLAFTGGIGEHDAVLRAEVCDRLKFLGVILDHEKNRLHTGAQAVSLHEAASTVEVWMIPTDEGRVAAQAAAALLQAQA
ncbi:acetate/propionate family kinase [Polaromonas sp.]|uniref:acetate/propionate family kinase n=1 Tax=Polaromonas sp. TaxID=1869339 RepID=UPI002486FF8C|nr:acetate/propionate family kinase [Polaromonas sp.]MDI1341488.1 acetate/propionate family kinase [Polaromonas sp.]